MTIGPYFIAIGWSSWLSGWWHFVNGHKYAPLYFRHDGERVVYCRGFVLALGPLMLWCTREINQENVI